MADFLQAVRWMMEGKKVWRKGTDKIFHKTALVCMVDQDGNDFKVTNTRWFLATDWEIYKDETKPDKRNKFTELGVILDEIMNDMEGQKR